MMNMQEFNTIYEELLFNWEVECTSVQIMPLPEEKLKKFISFQKEIHQLEHHAPPTDATEETRSIMWELKRQSSKNVDYILNDLLAIRQEKIIELCKNIDVIDQSLLTLSEQDFSRNLLSAFKGYQKTKQYHNAIAESCIEDEKNEDSDEVCGPESVASEKLEYCDIRILKDAPSLVGADFVIYGPFQKEDIVRLPKKSAQIMEKERIVEILE